MTIAIIGGGIFGLSLAIFFKKKNIDVIVFEECNDILLNASLNNHNRIHFGFHYPRSEKTCKQCLSSHNCFFSYFKDAIINNFSNYYLIEKTSKINSKQYESFCNNMSLKYTKNYPDNDIIDISFIENSYLTEEPIFDYNILKDIIKNYIKQYNITIKLNTKINCIDQLKDYKYIINTTYYNLNYIKDIFKLPKIKLKLQDVIIPIFEWNYKKIGLTIMDGNFCSIMPKGNETNMFLLYHVKYSVIKSTENYYIPEEWHNDKIDINKLIEKIYNESKKYYPFLNNIKKIGYWRSYRAIPINDNDARETDIYMDDYQDKKIISLLSGKITTSILSAQLLYEKLNIIDII
jgi:hypothetical protein